MDQPNRRRLIGLHAYGTNIERDWDEVVVAIKRRHEVIDEMGTPRISTTIQLGARTDRDQTGQDKVASVESQLAEDAT